MKDLIIKIILVIFALVVLTGCSSTPIPTNNDNPIPTANGEFDDASNDVFDRTEWFAQTVKAYAVFQTSGFTIYDENLLGGELNWDENGNIAGYNELEFCCAMPSFVFTYNDENTPILLIGVETDQGAFIFSVYALIEDTPIFITDNNDAPYSTLWQKAHSIRRVWRSVLDF